MYEWKLQVKIDECEGLILNPQYSYTLVAKMGNTFSSRSLPVNAVSNRLSFNTLLTLQFTTSTTNMHSQHLQILLIYNESAFSPRGINTKKEQISAMSTIKIIHPLPIELTFPKIYYFDKGIDSKAYFRASFSLAMILQSPRRLLKKKSAHLLQMQQVRSQKDSEKKKILKKISSNDSIKKIVTTNVEEQLTKVIKERNQLYKLSESLYQQLKKCNNQRDKHVRQLRERQISEQQIRQQLQFLKLKIQEYSSQAQQHAPANSQELQRLINENGQMKNLLKDKQAQLKELQRKVKQCLIAIDQFRKQAIEARTDLINKQSELSLISKNSKYLDPYECIGHLYQQLQNRKFTRPYQFNQSEQNLQQITQHTIHIIKRQTTKLFTQLMIKLKANKDKQWLIQQKIAFQGKIDALLNI